VRSLFAPTHWRLDEPSPFEANRILEPAPNPDFAQQVLSHLQDMLPAFRNARTRENWGGVMTATPDDMPILSPVDSVAGLFVGAAFSNGLTIAPSAGELMADLATGATPRLDIAAYRLARLT
jgi:glycine/D-amino acid oxidase-like deaminating enzyme